MPTVLNGGVSAHATTWTFHMRPGLLWSDGQPYDARDVEFTWRLWNNAKFAAGSILGLNLISSTEISADHLSITFHLKDSTLIYPPTQNSFEALYFNIHNTVLTTHPEVRQAMAVEVDQQTIIAEALKGLGTPLCTDHPAAYHPGFEPVPPAQCSIWRQPIDCSTTTAGCEVRTE